MDNFWLYALSCFSCSMLHLMVAILKCDQCPWAEVLQPEQLQVGSVGMMGWQPGQAMGFGLVGLSCQGCSLLFRVLGTHTSYCQNVVHMSSMHHM